MTGLRARMLERVRDGRFRGDGGTSLMEVTVTVTIMAVVMSIFTTGILQIFKATNQVERVSVAQTQLTIALAKLDKQIRYATAISDPQFRTADGHWYVEFLIGFTGVETCHQLRLNTTKRQLEERTWVHDTVPLQPAAWLPLASEVTPPSAGQPAEKKDGAFYRPDDDSSFKRLQLWLFTAAGGNDQKKTAETKLMFTALNSGPGDSDTTCTEGRGV